jgi:hypothetical protein
MSIDKPIYLMNERLREQLKDSSKRFNKGLPMYDDSMKIPHPWFNKTIFLPRGIEKPRSKKEEIIKVKKQFYRQTDVLSEVM